MCSVLGKDEDFGNTLLQRYGAQKKSKGCVACLGVFDTHALAGKDFSEVWIPEVLCARCAAEADRGCGACCVRAGAQVVSGAREALPWLFGYTEVSFVKVVAYEPMLKALLRPAEAQCANNDQKGFGQLLVSVQDGLRAYADATAKMAKTCGTPQAFAKALRLEDKALELHVRLAYTRACDPWSFRRGADISPIERLRPSLLDNILHTQRQSDFVFKFPSPAGPAAALGPADAADASGPAGGVAGISAPVAQGRAAGDAPRVRLGRNGVRAPGEAEPQISQLGRLQTVLADAVMAVDDEEGCFAKPLFGEDVPVEVWEKLPLDPNFEITRKQFDELHLNDQADVLAAAESFAIQQAGALEPFDLQAGIASGKVKPQGMMLLPGDSENRVFVAAATTNNLEAACRMRHLKPATEPPTEIQRLFGLCSKKLQAAIVKGAGGEKGVRAKTDEFLVDFGRRFPKKMTENDVQKWMLEAILFMHIPVVLRNGKAGVSRPLRVCAHVKPNESLRALKPRAIFHKDKLGTVIHMCDAGLAEFIIFSIPFFEKRSVKHCTRAGLSRRLASFVGEGKEKFVHLNTDFGAFDSCVRQWVRDLVENDFARMLAGITNSAHVKAAAILRGLAEQKAKGSGLVIEGSDWCRMSGDRGTSVYNYLVNWVLFLTALLLMLMKLGFTETEALLEVQRVLDDDEQKLADLVAEGDDGWQFLCRAIVERYKDKFPEGEFVAAWAETFAQMGFILEPQVEGGREVTAEALCEPNGRSEFVSQIIVPYPTARGVQVRLVPKPRKSFDSLCVTFNLPTSEQWATGMAVREATERLYEKAMSSMANSVESPLLYGFHKCVFDWAASQRGEREVDEKQFVQTVGYKYIELQGEYGDKVSEYPEAIARKRAILAHDGAGDSAADLAVAREFRRSATTSQLPCTDMDALLELREWLSTLQNTPPDSFLGAWRCLRAYI